MKNIESVSCDVSNGMVYVYDQDGCFFDSYSYPDIENAYSIGRGIVIETESMIYTYSLCGNYLKCTGSRSRLGGCKPPSDDLRAKDANRTEQDHDSSSVGYYPGPPSTSSSNSSGFGCITILVLGCVVGLCKAFFSNGGQSTKIATEKGRKACEVPAVIEQRQTSQKQDTNGANKNSHMRWNILDNGDVVVHVSGSYSRCRRNGENVGDARDAELCLRNRNGVHKVYIVFRDKVVPDDLTFCGCLFSPELDRLVFHDCRASENNDGLFFADDVVGLIDVMNGKSFFMVSYCNMNDGLQYTAVFNIEGVFDKYCELGYRHD